MAMLTRRGALERLAAAVAAPWTIRRLDARSSPDWQGTPMRFEVYRDARRKFRWRLKSGNGQVMASGESYNSKASCLTAIERIQQGAGGAEIVDTT